MLPVSNTNSHVKRERGVELSLLSTTREEATI